LSSQKEKKKRSIEDKEQLLIFSKKINNSLSLLTTMKAARMIKQKSAKHVRIFSSSIEMMRDEEIKFFKRNDFVTFVQALRNFFKVKVYTIYKRKNQKIKLSDICVSDDFKSNDDAS
jgi:predicted methyltransferase